MYFKNSGSSNVQHSSSGKILKMTWRENAIQGVKNYNTYIQRHLVVESKSHTSRNITLKSAFAPCPDGSAQDFRILL